MARIYNRNHYVMQLHIGTYLDANTSHVKSVGQSTGFDCCDDAAPVKGVGELLNNLTTIGELPKTIIYPLDGTKIETWAILAAGFCDNGTKAKFSWAHPGGSTIRPLASSGSSRPVQTCTRSHCRSAC